MINDPRGRPCPPWPGLPRQPRSPTPDDQGMTTLLGNYRHSRSPARKDTFGCNSDAFSFSFRKQFGNKLVSINVAILFHVNPRHDRSMKVLFYPTIYMMYIQISNGKCNQSINQYAFRYLSGKRATCLRFSHICRLRSLRNGGYRSRRRPGNSRCGLFA